MLRHAEWNWLLQNRTSHQYNVRPLSEDKYLLVWGWGEGEGWRRVSQSVQSFSRVRLFATPWIAACQASLSITNSRSSLKLTSIESVMPSSHLILCHPLFLLPQSLPASEFFPMSQLFAWSGQSTGVSALASFLPKNTQGWSPLEWTGWSPCSPRDSQDSSPIPQFRSISSSALSFLHSPTLTSIHDHWKNHSLD